MHFECQALEKRIILVTFYIPRGTSIIAERITDKLIETISKKGQRFLKDLAIEFPQFEEIIEALYALLNQYKIERVKKDTFSNPKSIPITFYKVSIRASRI